MTWQRLKRFYRKHDLQIVFVSALLIGLVLYFFGQTRELGLNFLTEISGVAITVLLVDRILKRRERQKTALIDQRILIELQSIFATHFSIWKHLMWKYLPEAQISDEKDFIKVYPELLSIIRISDSFEIVSIHHPESWKLSFHNKTIKECFENYYSTMNENITAFSNNFRVYLEPQLLFGLLEIVESEYFRNIKSVAQIEDTKRVIIDFGLDPEMLDSYLDITDVDHIEKMAQLFLYSEQLKLKITEFIEINYEPYNLKSYFKNPLLTYRTS